MIRIAHIIGSVCKGGVESVVFNYYRFIDKSKVQFDFIIDEDSPCEVPDDILALGCKVYKIPSYKHLPSYIKSIQKIFRDGKYGIVHSHMNTLSVFAMYAAKKANVSVRIAHSHSTAGKGEFARNLMKYALRPFSKTFPTHLFACSEYAGRWLFGNKAYNAGKVKVINNAIDVSKFVYNEEIRNRVRDNLQIQDSFVIGHVGRFMTQKNHTFLIDIFAEVYKNNSDSVLLLIGDGELRETIEAKVNQLNLQENVIFLGSRYDVHDLYQAMDVFLFPSLYEGLGIVLIEAQTSGLACIVSDVVPIEAKITNSVEYVSLKESVSYWAERVLYYTNGYERKNMSNIIKEAGFNIKKVLNELETFYCDILYHITTYNPN